MIKVFKIVNKILLALSVTLFCVSIILPGITLETADVAFLTYVLANTSVVIAAVVGAVLICSNNDIAKRIGNGLTVSAFVIGLAVAIIQLGESTYAIDDEVTATGSPTAAVIMLIATIVLALSYIFNLIIFILNKDSNENLNSSEDIRIIRTKEWKQLMEEGIITQEEFEEKRVQILGLKPKTDKKNLNKN